MQITGWLLPKKTSAPLATMLSNAKVPHGLSSEYLVLAIEYRKREYLLAAEHVARVHWYIRPHQLWKAYRAYRIYRTSIALLIGEHIRAMPPIQPP
jgi:hypothetical protein